MLWPALALDLLLASCDPPVTSGLLPLVCLLDTEHPLSSAQSMESHSLERSIHSPRVKQLGVRLRLQDHTDSEVVVMLSQKEVRFLQVHFTDGKTESLS